MKVHFCDETNKQMYMRDCPHEYEAKRSMKREDRHEGQTKIFGGDALRGNTRSHPEHDGKDLSCRWYCTGDGVGE